MLRRPKRLKNEVVAPEEEEDYKCVFLHMLSAETNMKTGVWSSLWEARLAYAVLVGKPEGKRILVKRRLMWEDNIKMDIKSVRRAWTDLVQDRGKWQAIVEAAMNLRVP